MCTPLFLIRLSTFGVFSVVPKQSSTLFRSSLRSLCTAYGGQVAVCFDGEDRTSYIYYTLRKDAPATSGVHVHCDKCRARKCIYCQIASSHVASTQHGPCAAVVREDPKSAVHGILFKLPLVNWPALLASEGVPLGYSVREVLVKTYAGSRIRARTLMDSPLSGSRESEGLPSERYLNLLKKGAQEQGIMKSYRHVLDQIETFK